MTKPNSTSANGKRRAPAPRYDSAAKDADFSEEFGAFLKGMPKAGETYSPQRAITRDLKALIEANGAEGAFTTAIRAVARQNIPELRRITTLADFYFYGN